MKSRCVTNAYGTKVWVNSKGQWHREDGPAVEWDSGYKQWCLNGLYHRLDGPAIEYVNGDKAWYKNDRLYIETI